MPIMYVVRVSLPSSVLPRPAERAGYECGLATADCGLDGFFKLKIQITSRRPYHMRTLYPNSDPRTARLCLWLYRIVYCMYASRIQIEFNQKYNRNPTTVQLYLELRPCPYLGYLSTVNKAVRRTIAKLHHTLPYP
jgi:hypothetical protein